MECEYPVRSGEEQHELQRSTKRMKDPVQVGIHDDDPTKMEVAIAKSYREKLLGSIPGAFAQMCTANSQQFVEEESDSDVEELIEGVARVNLSKETKIRIRGAWDNALIVKVFGRTVGFHYMHRSVMSLWKPQGRVDCMDLGRDFFLFKFEAKDDMDRVLSDGPWFIGGHFVAIRLWEPNFKASMAVVSTVAVWVRLNELPVEYYDAAALREIGSAIGPVLKVDTNTASGTRGRYARLCVQIDLSKPLVRTIQVGKLIQGVLYEGIGALCFACGRVGHRNDGCPHVIRGPEEGNSAKQVEGKGKDSRVEVHESTEEDGYGPWMVVKRKKTSPKQMKSVEPTLVRRSGSPSLVSPTRTIMGKSEAHTPVGGPSISFNGNNVRHEGLEGNKEKTSACIIADRQKSKQTSTKSLAVGGYGRTHSISELDEFTTLGDQRPKEGCGNAQRGDKANKGKVDEGLVVAQPGAEGSVEVLLPSHFDESGAGVDASHGSSNATGSGDGAIEDLPGRFSSAGLVRIRLSSQFRGEENYGEAGRQGIPGRAVTREARSVRWLRPSPGWVRLNTDGSSLGNPGKAGGGGLIRDENGSWIKGFIRNIGFSSSMEAELWALRDGLSLCLSLNIYAVEVEIDAKVVCGWITNSSSSNLNLSPLIVDCRTLLSRIPQVKLNHCYREANQCADALAKKGSVYQQDFMIFDSPPVDISMLLYYDSISMYYERTSPPTSFPS
ncbi:hypothetical protein SO802_018822 [Lithocarpus litseifolius]|uniref:CCHC-type domain-containing protein n=1 Tax=Lithocarpus litseifolius TaxID=425828 RepID=A0AAW2CM20_9ROSI